jgi:hypothetical protein
MNEQEHTAYWRGYNDAKDAIQSGRLHVWLGLTQDEQDKVFKTFSKSDAYKRDFLNRIASAIEAKLKEKNT